MGEVIIFYTMYIIVIDNAYIGIDCFNLYIGFFSNID